MRRAGFTGRAESGQVAVEAALVLPLLLFLGLGIVQLTLLQQAKLFTEYSAYNAARAGIVWNGNNERMRDAAVLSVLPTFGRTDGMTALGNAYERFVAHDEALQNLAWNTPVPESLLGSYLRGAVRVDTVSPANYPELKQLWRLRDAANWQELDLDGPEGFPEFSGRDEHYERFLDPSAGDPEAALYRKATVLSIRVRYLYELRIPFANFVLFTSWFASNAGERLFGSIAAPTLNPQANATSLERDVDALETRGRGIAQQKGFASLYPGEMQTLWQLSTGALSLGSGPGRRYFIPLTATYSMRMQSNFHRKWVMHEDPSWGP